MTVSIYNKIKISSKKQFEKYILLLIACIIIFLNCPFISVFHPTEINDISTVTSKDKYVKITTSNLHYTGYTFEKIGHKKYGYYYTIKNSKSLFVLLPVDSTPKETLSNYSFKGKVTKPNRTYKKMLSMLVKDLNWNEASMNDVNNDFFISNADYNIVPYIILFWLLIFILLTSIYKLINYALYFAKPYTYNVCPFKSKEEQRYLIKNANIELNSDNYIQINSMYITENYLVDLTVPRIYVIPLNDIIWCYRVGKFAFNSKKTATDFSLVLTSFDGITTTLIHKTSDEALELLNTIRATEANIIIGFSDSKKHEAKQIIAANK